LEKIEDFLEFNLLEEADLLLIMLISMSMSILDSKLAIVEGFELVAEVEECTIANSLMNTTIQDSSKRERSNEA